MKRKILLFWMMGMMMVTVAACGQKPEGNQTESQIEEQTEEAAVQEIAEETQQADPQETLEEEEAEASAEDVTEEENENAAETTEEAENSTVYEATLEELAALLGMQDSETADLLGGGEENWTEDKSFYIGRNYEIKLYGEAYPAHTSCDDEKMVNAVSVWLANGERTLSEEEVEQWVQRLTDFVGTEPSYDDISSEAGTRKWKWVSEDRIISLMWTDELLSINMNIAVGELK